MANGSRFEDLNARIEYLESCITQLIGALKQHGIDMKVTKGSETDADLVTLFDADSPVLDNKVSYTSWRKDEV